MRFALLSAALTAALAGGAWGAVRSTPPTKFVAHEWGTFTSMQGAPGEILDGLHHESESLPGFVYSRTESHQSPFRLFGDRSLNVRHVRHVNGKMETPVLYFYGSPSHVSVHVDFTNGLLTQWYPAASSVSPKLDASPAEIDLAKINTSSIDWDVDTMPYAKGAPQAMPSVDRDAPWGLARDVKADYVVPRGAPAAEAEHYLFYRGLGRMDVPIQVDATDAFALVRNTTIDDLPAAFAVDMGESSGRFLALGAIRSGSALPAMLMREPMQPKTLVISRLEDAVHDALVSQGLFDDEARAMVKTWSSTWFGQEGHRILYLVPRAQTDATIPLRITPAPDTLTRVLVGRLEYLEPAEQAEIAKAIAARDSNDVRIADASQARLAKLGRFLEPAVRGIMASSQDPDVRRNASEILAAFAGN